MPTPFSLPVFPGCPSEAIPGEALLEVPHWGGQREDAWPTPDRLSERPPLFTAEDDGFDVPHWKRPPRPRRSAQAQAMLAMYDALDTLWRLSQWVDAQEPGAQVKWSVDEPPYGPDPSDPSPSGPPYLSVVQVDAQGKESHYWLGGLDESLASVLQTACHTSAPAGSFDARTPLEERIRAFAGPAAARWWKNLALDQSLPAPSRRPAGPRF